MGASAVRDLGQRFLQRRMGAGLPGGELLHLASEALSEAETEISSGAEHRANKPRAGSASSTPEMQVRILPPQNPCGLGAV